ncbi:hypothetical protein ATEG_06714 [Aspergillus terreus NIH2624]|uniref:Fumarylacetoacetase-like C-terminal domain-containing protein n=1 Tax=Aspergillus terreus (strain NIH 2624 / FGSC A1156) TaxID=341663 RepID=Q0CHX0_ASPTN|nr:uncharacterized protein ATEG_06714 [Aspergillus terreus NIH2624]EAU33258.1 hypothetical protein ATEG_06714 [Aspergillus terreus NIH2624]
MSLPWKRLIRFVATDGRILRGEPIVSNDVDLGFVTESDQIQARVISGDDIYDTTGKTRVTDEVVTVKTLLGPAGAGGGSYSALRGVKLREAHPRSRAYASSVPFHLLQAEYDGPRPRRPGGDPQDRADDQADYEGELVRESPSAVDGSRINSLPRQCLVIGKDAKNVPVEKALEYVAAYTVGNDISSRKLQRDPAFAGRVPQWGFSKGFDTYAPLGPCLVAGSEIPDPTQLHLRTTVDGEVRQDESVSDLLFDCKYLISYLSQGTTLQKGSVIMTGTPGGVGAGLTPPKYLVPGTQMDVHITKIGTLRNNVVFA